MLRNIICIVNDIRNFAFGLAGASVYGSCKNIYFETVNRE